MNGAGRAAITSVSGRWGDQGAGASGEDAGGAGPRAPAPEPRKPLTPWARASIPQPPPRGGTSWGRIKAPRDCRPAGRSGWSPCHHSPTLRLQVGVLRLLLPLRRQRCYGDHRSLATKLHRPGHLLALWLWEWTCVQKPPSLRKPTCEDKPGEPGKGGRAETPPGSVRITCATIPHTSLACFFQNRK